MLRFDPDSPAVVPVASGVVPLRPGERNTGPFASVSDPIRKLVHAFAGERAVRVMATVSRSWCRIAREYPVWTAFSSLPQTVVALGNRPHLKEATLRCDGGRLGAVVWPAGLVHAGIHLDDQVSAADVCRVLRPLPAEVKSLFVSTQACYYAEDTQARADAFLTQLPRLNVESLWLVMRGYTSLDYEKQLRGLARWPKLKRLRVTCNSWTSFVSLQCLLILLDAPLLEDVITNHPQLNGSNLPPLPNIKSIRYSRDTDVSVLPSPFAAFARAYPKCEAVSGFFFPFSADDLKDLRQTKDHPLFGAMQRLSVLVDRATPADWAQILRVMPAFVNTEVVRVAFRTAADVDFALGAKVINPLLKNRRAADCKGPLVVLINVARAVEAELPAILTRLYSTPSSTPGAPWMLQTYIVSTAVSVQAPTDPVAGTLGADLKL